MIKTKMEYDLFNTVDDIISLLTEFKTELIDETVSKQSEKLDKLQCVLSDMQSVLFE